MAGPIETRGQLQEFLEILSRRRWQILLPAAFVIVLGVAFAVIVPKKYLVRTQVELRPVGVSVSSKDGANAPFQLRARERLNKVVQKLKNQQYLTMTPEERNQLLADIQDDIKVRLDRGTDGNTSFVNIEYSSVDALWARTFLPALRDDWINDVLERDRNKLRDEKAKLLDEKVKLSKQLDTAENTLAELRRKNGLSATQPLPSADVTRNEDPVYARLQQRLRAIDDIDLQLVEKRVQLRNLRERYEKMPEFVEGESQVVAGESNEAELKALDLEIIDKQTLIKGYRPFHPRFRELSAELEKLEERREQTARVVTRSDIVTSTKPNPDRPPLARTIDELEDLLATLNATRKQLRESADEDTRRQSELHAVYEQLNVQGTRASILRDNLRATDARLTSKSQELEVVEGPLANPFSITEEVIPPSKPTEPNPSIIVAFSIVAGLALGLALAIALEFSKSSFRNVHELGRIMVVPVLGSINRIVTRRELRMLAARRVLVGVSSILLIGSVVFVTWAWAKSPELLSNGVREKIELLRTRFR